MHGLYFGLSKNGIMDANPILRSKFHLDKAAGGGGGVVPDEAKAGGPVTKLAWRPASAQLR